MAAASAGIRIEAPLADAADAAHASFGESSGSPLGLQSGALQSSSSTSAHLRVAPSSLGSNSQSGHAVREVIASPPSPAARSSGLATPTGSPSPLLTPESQQSGSRLQQESFSQLVPSPEHSDGRCSQGLNLVDEPLSYRQHLYLLVEDPESSFAARVLSHFLFYTIVISIVAFVLETVPHLRDLSMWKGIEIYTTVVFTLEYLVRFSVSDALQGQTKCGFVRNPMNILDLLAVLPLYFEALLSSVRPLRVLRSVRLIRCFRIFKLSKYSDGMQLMIESLVNSLQPLSILMFFLLIGTLLFSSMIFFAERSYCPDVSAMLVAGTFAEYEAECLQSSTGYALNGDLCCDRYGSADGFESIPVVLWWAVVTMTTVGYGDIVPRTLLGRLVCCMAMLSGILLISLPVAIVGSKFQQAYETLQDEKARLMRLNQEERTRMLQDSQRKSHLHHQSSKHLQRLLEVVQAEEEERCKKAAELGSSSMIDSRDTDRSMTQSAMSQHNSDESSRHKRSLKAAPLSAGKATILDRLRSQLRRIEGCATLSGDTAQRATDLMELFDHIERVERQLSALQEKDMVLDEAISRDFMTLLRGYDTHLKIHGRRRSFVTSAASQSSNLGIHSRSDGLCMDDLLTRTLPMAAAGPLVRAAVVDAAAAGSSNRGDDALFDEQVPRSVSSPAAPISRSSPLPAARKANGFGEAASHFSPRGGKGQPQARAALRPPDPD
mmetsp:Transcript_74026/g.176212  ORF Transcript_74026/g.176212 Transcript_74026/m.176212 type:complete len:720 (-) Transcript_74026:86-2245(-)